MLTFLSKPRRSATTPCSPTPVLSPLVSVCREIREGEATTRAIEACVKLLGLQPRKAREPLPPIDEDKVVLVVWSAVETEA